MLDKPLLQFIFKVSDYLCFLLCPLFKTTKYCQGLSINLLRYKRKSKDYNNIIYISTPPTRHRLKYANLTSQISDSENRQESITELPFVIFDLIGWSFPPRRPVPVACWWISWYPILSKHIIELEYWNIHVSFLHWINKLIYFQYD